MADTKVVYPRLKLIGPKDNPKIIYQEQEERPDLPANETEALLRWRLTGEL